MMHSMSAMQLRPYDWDLFGLGVTSQEIRDLTMLPRWNHDTLRRVNHQIPPVTVGKDGYQVSIDVQQFRPSEITVKTVGNTVIVEGKHEERQDEHGYIARHFMRKYTLPKGYNSNDVTSSLSSDGILTIMAPKPKKNSASNERIVPVQHTGPAHLHVKDNTAAGDEQQEKIVNSKSLA